MNDSPPSFDELLSRLLDGELSEAERTQLVNLLEQDPARITVARQHLEMGGRLHALGQARTDEHFVRSVTSHVQALADEEPNAFPQKVHLRVQRAQRHRTIFATLALAACVALACFLFIRESEPATPLRPPIATAIHFPDQQAQQAVVTEIHEGEELRVEAGRLKLEFVNGAVVAVESPAHLSIRSVEEILLHSGNLNAWCPDSAHGFRVTTRTAQLKDLGTSFGVSANPDGSSDFLVLDGEVEVSNADELRTLPKGEALRASSSSGLEVTKFDPGAFSRTWPLASGIESTHGEVIPAPPNIPEVVAAHEDDDHIIVIPERRNLELPEHIRADIREPGLYESSSIFNTAPLRSQPGTRGRSYLLRYNPVGIVDVGEFKRFEGSVTFDRPVLAIITSTEKLDASDAFASAAPLPATAEDISMRGLESAQPPHPTDGVQLSADRRTVSVIFWAGESVDEIRVITAED